MKKPIILFVMGDNINKINYRLLSPHWISSEIGFKTYAVNWKNITVKDGSLIIQNGYESISLTEKRRVENEEIVPNIILHYIAIRKKSSRLISKISSVLPNSYISYHPAFKHFCKKWTMELCFQNNEKKYPVSRPKTYLTKKNHVLEKIGSVGVNKNIIIKPSSGSACKGIVISTPNTIQNISKSLKKNNTYVCQELINNPILYEQKKFDLRIYAIITSINPLKYKVYKEGVTRIAAKKYDHNNLDDRFVSLTGFYFQKRHKIKPESITISKLLNYLENQGDKIDDFWERIEHTLRNVFECFADHCMKNKVNFSNNFFITTIDLALQKTDTSYKILFLELNYVARLNEGWGKQVDTILLDTKKEIFTDLLNHIQN